MVIMMYQKVSSQENTIIMKIFTIKEFINILSFISPELGSSNFKTISSSFTRSKGTRESSKVFQLINATERKFLKN